MTKRKREEEDGMDDDGLLLLCDTVGRIKKLTAEDRIIINFKKIEKREDP